MGEKPLDFLMEIIMDFFIEPKIGDHKALRASNGGNATILPLASWLEPSWFPLGYENQISEMYSVNVSG